MTGDGIVSGRRRRRCGGGEEGGGGGWEGGGEEAAEHLPVLHSPGRGSSAQTAAEERGPTAATPQMKGRGRAEGQSSAGQRPVMPTAVRRTAKREQVTEAAVMRMSEVKEEEKRSEGWM